NRPPCLSGVEALVVTRATPISGRSYKRELAGPLLRGPAIDGDGWESCAMLLAMAGRVYRPDHTAHIRAELARSATLFATGLVVVLAAAGTVFLIAQLTDLSTAPVWLVQALW